MATIKIEQLRKTYGGIVAVDGMDLEVAPGSIHAVVGENGAGKSTLMKILAGAVRPDSGTITVDGSAVELRLGAGRPRPRHRHRLPGAQPPARAARCSPTSSSTDQPTRFGLVVAARDASSAPAACSSGSASTSTPTSPSVGLTIGERQLVEIGRVLLERPRVLILDEPNSALNERETRRLFAILRELAAEGITILYVSHRLEEVFEIADRITVMRNGARGADPGPRAT